MSAFDISIRDLALKKQRKRLEQERRNLIYVVCDERIDKRQATFKNTIEGVDSIAGFITYTGLMRNFLKLRQTFLKIR
ncbi:MAG: hypothetical protein ACE5PV_25330 [Candidatus Poribacteria bacterium]